MENSKKYDCVSEQELVKRSQAKPGLFFAFSHIIWGHMPSSTVILHPWAQL